MKYIKSLLAISLIICNMSVHALDLFTVKLPLSFKCHDVASGGVMLDKKSGQWKGQVFAPEKIEFKLTIDKFDSDNLYNKEQCAMAIMAVGKRTDEASKSYRDTKRKLCVLEDYANRERLGLDGPELKYCRVTNLGKNDQLSCEEFSFDSEQQTYFHFAPVSMGFDSGTSYVIAGKCSVTSN